MRPNVPSTVPSASAMRGTAWASVSVTPAVKNASLAISMIEPPKIAVKR